MQNNPIGIFDSGLGGLTVLKAVQKALPHESFVYLGDTARLPYGSKSPENVTEFSLQNAKFLIQKFDIKLLIIACHTASAFALEALKGELDIPVVGVIEPVISQINIKNSICLLGTHGTVNSKIYNRLIPNLKSKACPLFVTLAEEGLTSGEITEKICDYYLANSENLTQACDTFILGCTHFPLLKKTLQKKYPQVKQWLEAGPACADQVKNILEQQSLLSLSSSSTKYIFTDKPTNFYSQAEQFLEQPIDSNSLAIMRDLS